jgi:hypothetical protein
MEETKPKRSVVMVKVVPGTPYCCGKCKWGLLDSSDQSRGICIAFRTSAGFGIRLIGDSYNTTCDNFTEGSPEAMGKLTVINTQVSSGKASG